MVVSNEPDFLQRIDQIFELQQKNRLAMANSSVTERKQRLKRLEKWILDHQNEIRSAIYNDFKKPAEETDLTEIFITLNELRHTLRHLSRWVKPQKVKRTRSLLTVKSWVKLEPRGVVLIISPWNFPFHLLVAPLISALAAGNCVMLKPSEYVPHTANLLKQMVEDLFPPEEVAIFLGDHLVAQALLKKPFDHVFFTGSTRVGKIVMKAAAEHLSSITLELGGKSPVVVDKSANLKDAAQKIVFGKYLNSGQTCIAPDYLLVHKEVQNEFEQTLRNELERMFGADVRSQKKAAYARIINEQHHQRLVNKLKQSVQKGGKIVTGGENDPQENFISPTLLQLPGKDTLLMEEEIFGPILPLIAFETWQQAVELINSIDPPLALYVFSKDRTFQQQIARNTRSGSICFNDVHLQYIHPNLPFGGLKASGIGSAHGFYGFKAFSYERAILKQGPISPLKWLFPPYNSLKRKLIELIIKYLT